MLKELILKNRSYRRFHQNKEIKMDTLKELVDLARLSSSGRNLQGLRYILVNKKETNNKIFECIFWAGYFKEWDGPEEGERPSAYMIIVKDSSLGVGAPQDSGIAIQSILLGAVEKGFGGCIIGNIDRKTLAESLNIDERYQIELVLALGQPKEEVVIDDVDESGNIKYWRDENQVHHVPKRKLEELILEI